MAAGNRRGRPRTTVTAAIGLALVASVLGPAPAGATQRGETIAAVSQPSTPTPGRDWAAARKSIVDTQAALARRAAPAVRWPSAGTADVAVTASPTRAGTLPLRIGGAEGQGRIRVDVRDRATAEKAGMRGLMFELTHTEGANKPVPVEVDYSGFKEAFGGDYATRLRLVKIGDKAPITSANNVSALRVTAELSDGLYALTSGPSGSTGSFQPTSLSASSTWQAGLQSGDFLWSYPMAVPTVPGLRPTVGLSYSSGAVDGRTASANNQPSWVGEGFDYQPGFIERSYRSCSQDGMPSYVADQCWSGYNAVISLPGASGPLVRDDATGKWRVGDDEGWLVEPLAGAVNGDDDGEYWRLTAPDGTRYHFGLNRLPGFTAGATETHSTWTVPVMGNNSGEPCSTAPGWCQQAYRWMLDYVEDTHGDAMAYFYDTETNYYELAGLTPVQYVRGGQLNRIEYGLRATSVYTVPASARVVFGAADRCIPGSACVQSQPANWPDVPWDQWCNAATCAVTAPTFWSSKRLASVTTQVYTGGTYQPVDSWTLTHSYPDPLPDQATTPALWLASIVHTGLSGGSTLATPPVTLSWTVSENRVDGAGIGLPAMYKMRIGDIATESGGHIGVSYAPRQCVRSALPPVDNNDKRCFPAMWLNGTTPAQDWWHKYVVSQVVESDLRDAGGTPLSPDQITTYEYVPGGHSWRHDDSELVPPNLKSWGQWHGFQTVRVRTGNPGSPGRTLTEHVFLKGMNGDINATGAPDSDVRIDGMLDEPWFTGFGRSTTVYQGEGGPMVERSVSVPQLLRNTAHHALSGGGSLDAYLIVENEETVLTPLSDGTTRTTKSISHYDPTYGTLDWVSDLNDTSTAADDTCTTHTYARNTDAWIIDTATRTETVAVACGTAASYPGDLISGERFFYDGQNTWGATPTAGDVTKTQEVASWSGGPVYADAGRDELDAHGRVTASFDALGNKTTTEYTPLTGGPVTAVKVTNALNRSTTVTVDPLLGVATKVSDDANGRVTQMAYDALGRLVKGWAPGRATSLTPTAQFEYQVRNDAPSSVRTSTLLGNGTSYLSSYTILDGFLRTRQTQTLSPAGGRILTDTLYDEYGRVGRANQAYWNNQSAPSSTLVVTADVNVPGQTEYVYDAAERMTGETFKAFGSPKWTTTTLYGGDRVSVTPPAGATPTTKIVDAEDQVVELRQYLGSAPSGAYDATRYTYTKAGQLETLTDPAGNIWRHYYDLRGRETRTDDPDAGTSTTTFDDLDQVLTDTDARGNTLAYSYDVLGRRTGLYNGSTTGTKLADWTYDTAPNGIGLPAASTRYAGGFSYKQEILGYDTVGRVTGTRVTIPGSEVGLATPFTFDSKVTAYNWANQPTTTNRGAVGDIPAETFTHSYEGTLGLPLTMTNPATKIVNASGYTELAEPASITHGAVGSQVVREFAYESGTRRLTTAAAKAKTSTVETPISSISYTYDSSGAIKKIADAVTGDNQCFTNDYLVRLAQAWTPSNGDCAAAPSVAALGGPASYWHSYTYDKTGNRQTEIQHAAAGDTTRNYTFPAAGAAQPHTLRSVTTTGPGVSKTDSLGYDATGNTTSRAVDGVNQAYTWDAEGHVASEAHNGVTTTYLYGADGNRLIRRDNTGTTVYLGEDELKYANGILTGTRYYSFGGDVVAVRTGGKLSWLLPDHHGTGQASVDTTTLAVSRRYSLPFGAPRGAAPAGWPGEKGFVGGTMDSSTGLTHLGAREYDPVNGRFISADPIVDVNDPQQLNGYAYASNNPVSLTDPDGLKADCGKGANCKLPPPPKPPKPPKKKGKDKAKDRGRNKNVVAVHGHPFQQKYPEKRGKASGKPNSPPSGHPSTRGSKAADKRADKFFKERDARNSKKHCENVRQCDGPDAKVKADAEKAKERERKRVGGCKDNNGGYPAGICTGTGGPRKQLGQKMKEDLAESRGKVSRIHAVAGQAELWLSGATLVCAAVCDPAAPFLAGAAKLAAVTQAAAGVHMAVDTCVNGGGSCADAVMEAGKDIGDLLMPLGARKLGEKLKEVIKK